MSELSPDIFTPSPAARPRLLSALADPFQSLHQVARAFETTLDALAAWMTRPDVQADLATIGNAAAFRSRLTATTLLPGAVGALGSILNTCSTLAADTPATSIATPEARESRRRHAETARRAAGLLHRIARFEFISTPRAPLAPRPPSSSLSPWESRRFAGEGFTSLSFSSARAPQPPARNEPLPSAPPSSFSACSPPPPSSGFPARSTPTGAAGVPSALDPRSSLPRAPSQDPAPFKPRSTRFESRPPRRAASLRAVAGSARPP